MSKKKIVVVGGGTGNHTTLSGLKYEECELTAVVAMSDRKIPARTGTSEIEGRPAPAVRIGVSPFLVGIVSKGSYSETFETVKR